MIQWLDRILFSEPANSIQVMALVLIVVVSFILHKKEF